MAVKASAGIKQGKEQNMKALYYGSYYSYRKDGNPDTGRDKNKSDRPFEKLRENWHSREKQVFEHRNKMHT